MVSWPYLSRKNARGVSTTWWTSRKPTSECRLRTRVSTWGQKRKEVGMAEARSMALLCLQREFCLYLHIPKLLFRVIVPLSEWLKVTGLKTVGLALKDLRVSQLGLERQPWSRKTHPYLRAHRHGAFREQSSPMASAYAPRQVTPCAWGFLTQNSFGQYLLLLGNDVDRRQVRKQFLRMVVASLPYGNVALLNREHFFF